MENILALLYEYSKRGRKVDEEFINIVIKVMIEEKDLRDYITKVSSVDLSRSAINNRNNTPMAYNTFTKEILVDYKNILLFQKKLESITRIGGFEHELLVNSWLIQMVLHEIEHANQAKKSVIRDDNFENLLLGVCCHVNNGFFEQSKIMQLLVLQMGINPDSRLHHDLVLIHQLYNQFNDSHPLERLANIHSTQEVDDMLVQISKYERIEHVLLLFGLTLARFLVKGYIYNNGIVTSPTEQYLEAVKKLDITGMDSHFNEQFSTAMKNAQDGTLESRLLLGLDISEGEYLKMKMKQTLK